MDWPTNYVYVPEWLLIVLAGLAFIGLEFVVARIVRQLDRWTRPRVRSAEKAPSAKILLLDDPDVVENRRGYAKAHPEIAQ